MDKLPVEYARCECLRTGTDEIVILADCASTGGALFAVEIRMQPGGGPPVMHRHDPGEIYFVRRGEFTFYLDDGEDGVRRVTAGPGDVVPMAGRTPHTVRNESAAEAVAFVVHAPGAPMENFSRGVAALEDPTMEKALAVAAENGIELLGPVPA